MTASYYQAGTVAVTNGSDTVTGSGTAFVANLTPGETFRLVSGGDQYEITAIISDTQFKIDPAYMGATQSGLDYRIVPIRGYGAQVIAAMTTAIGLWTGFRDGPLAGLFGDGAAGDSGIGFQSAPGTGWWRKTNGDLAGQRNGTELLTLETGQVRIKKLVGDAVQSSLTDATAGRLGVVGGFGLGGESIFAGFDIDAVDNSIAPGWYHFDASTVTGTSPVATGNIHMLHRRRNSGGGEYQTAILESSSVPETYIRTRVTVGWSDWVRLDVTSGSNPNGRFTRYPDGTQICTSTITTSAAGPVTWNYPSSFAESPRVTGVGAGSTVPFILTWDSRGATSVDWNGWKTDGTRFAVGTDVTAVGRWF